jgi:hypothetical protein
MTDSFSPTFIHYFVHILLIGCPIDHILFMLHSYLRGDHSYAIGWCVHYRLVVFWPWVLNLGHRPILVKEYYSAPVQPPPPPVASLGPSLVVFDLSGSLAA